MKIWEEPIEFDWDEGNTGKNKKHDVEDKEAEESFTNKPILVSKDKKHSKKEPRFQALGQTDNGRFLFVSFTIRNGKVRIISARDMDREEESVYEKV